MVARRPDIGNDDLAVIRSDRPCKLRQRRVRVDVGRALPVVEEAAANLMASQVQVTIDVEVVLVKVAGRRWLKCPNRNRQSINGFRRSIGDCRRWKLAEDRTYAIVRCHAVQLRQTRGRGSKLLHCCCRQTDIRELVSAINEQFVPDERASNVRPSSVTVNSSRSGQA